MQVSYAGIICNRANIHIHHRIDFILPATRKPTCLVIPCKYSSSKSKSCMKIIYLTCDPVREWIPLLMAFLILCIHIQLINLRYISCHGRLVPQIVCHLVMHRALCNFKYDWHISISFERNWPTVVTVELIVQTTHIHLLRMTYFPSLLSMFRSKSIICRLYQMTLETDLTYPNMYNQINFQILSR